MPPPLNSHGIQSLIAYIHMSMALFTSSSEASSGHNPKEKCHCSDLLDVGIQTESHD